MTDKKLENLVEEGNEIVLNETDFECDCGCSKFFCGINVSGHLVIQCVRCDNIRILTKEPQNFILEATHLSDNPTTRENQIQEFHTFGEDKVEDKSDTNDNEGGAEF